MTTKPLIVFALEQESRGLFTGYECLYTGVGKINATYALMSYLTGNQRPSCIINLGTAGSSTAPTGSLVQCTKFIQRDMDVTPLGFSAYQTPFSDIPATLTCDGPIADLPQAVCGSGDHFETAHKGEAYDIVDMEAYALAFICHREKIPFLCIKYISDGADDNAHLDWDAALEDGARKLKAVLDRLAI